MAIFFSSGQFIQITRQDQHTCESTKIYTFVIPNHSQMYDQHDTDLAAPILREAFKNDPIFGDFNTGTPFNSDTFPNSTYPTTASLQEIVSGPMDRIRGPNVIRLAKSYGNSTMAELINAAHPGETNINGNNIGERLHAAYAAAGDDGDELKREVNDARVGLGVKVRGRDKDTATAEGSRRSGRNG